MAWFGDGLSSLSNLKGQITNFTKEVLSEGIVEEMDERSRKLHEANERCVQLQELLNSKDAEISLLRRQNSELQKTVIELNAKPKDSNESKQDDDGSVFFWDPPIAKNRAPKSQNQIQTLQEQLSQATVRIRELEGELKRLQKVNASSMKDEVPDGHQKAEFLRAKQDMMNRIIQLEEKSREAERNAKRMQLDETTLINDFRTVISKLEVPEKLSLVRGALKALETENEKSDAPNKEGVSRLGEKFEKLNLNGHEPAALKLNCEGDTNSMTSDREIELRKKIEELQEENKTLFSNIEELDQQQAESIEKLLSMKEELEKKHHCLQKAYEQLYVDYNEAERKAAELEAKLAPATKSQSTCEVINQSLQTESMGKEEKDVQVETPTVITDAVRTEVLNELEHKIKGVLKNCCVDMEPRESIFEAVAKQYVDATWKKDVLERKVTEVTRDLKEAVEIKDSLQLECDDMQAHIDSLLMEIQRLKLNLPSIPEASEERVASLETETESLQEDIKKLQAENDALRKKNLELTSTVENLEVSLKNHKNHVESNAGSAEDSTELNFKGKIETLKKENKELQERLSDLCVLIDTRTQRECVACKNLKKIVYDLEQDKKELKEENEKLGLRMSERFEADEEARKYLVEDLGKELDAVKSENKELEHEIREVLNEMEEVVREKEAMQSELTQLSQDNENLREERQLLTDQLTDIYRESVEKVELLNTEKSVLEQEHAELKQELSSSQEELRKVKENLQESVERNKNLANEVSTLNSKLQVLQAENESSYDKIKRIEELEAELNTLRPLAKIINTLRTECSEMENELRTLRFMEKEFSPLQSHLAQQETTIKRLEEEGQISRNRCLQLESEIQALRSKNEESMQASNKHIDDERQQVLEFLKEKERENDTLQNENSRLMTEISDVQNKLYAVLEEKDEAAAMARKTIENLSHLVKEKDSEIETLKASIEEEKSKNTESLEDIKNQRDELLSLVQFKHNESLQYHSDVERLTKHLSEQIQQIQNLNLEICKNSELLKEKDAQLLWTQNELQVVQQRLRNFEESNNYGETCGIVEHSTQARQLEILNEKCNALEDALIQEQSNNRILQNQLTESQSKETNAARELERLRSHLVEMESSYTEEALLAETTRKELEAKLVQAEEKVKNSSTVYTSASIRANQQVETLQQQMALIIQQRDDIQNKLSIAEDKVLAQTASLTNLQLVLEQFLQDKEKDIKSATEKIQSKLNESYRKQEALIAEVSDLKEQLAEAKEGLQAASRLTEQLDRKAERIEFLNQEVERLTELVNTAEQKIAEAKQSGEGKVDKTLIKNLLLGYLSSSASDKSSVLRVFATVLDFNEAERDKANLNNTNANTGWFSRLSGSNAPPTKDQEASLTAAFVRFLESESKPKPQLPALPISSSPLSRPGHSRQHSTSSTQSTLLLSNVNLPTFPDFVPARNTGSILKEVLRDS